MGRPFHSLNGRQLGQISAGPVRAYDGMENRSAAAARQNRYPPDCTCPQSGKTLSLLGRAEWPALPVDASMFNFPWSFIASLCQRAAARIWREIIQAVP